jgi:hypothetical protein
MFLWKTPACGYALTAISGDLRDAEKTNISTLLAWSWRRDLNPRPSDYKSDALPTELRQLNPLSCSYKHSARKTAKTRATACFAIQDFV